MTEHITATSRGAAGGFGEVAVAVHDVATLRRVYPGWGSYPKHLRAWLARRVQPTGEQQFHNVQLNQLHRYLVDHLDRSQPGTPERHFDEFAVGTDGGATDPTDTGLGDQVYQTTVAQSVDEGRDLFVSGFLDSSEANGNTLREFGIVAVNRAGTASDVYANRALFDDPVEKSNEKTVSVDATVGWRSRE
jgi:hypothetical protein